VGTFARPLLRAALRAYVATQQLEKAEETMNALEKAGGPRNVTKTYIGLGRQLEDSLKRLRAEGNQEEAAKAARGFEFFLTRIAARPASESEFGVLYWVAETFMNLGDSLSPDDAEPSPEAVADYQKAAGAFTKIIEACQSDPRFVPQRGLLTNVQIRLARCLRRLGRYEEALDTLVEILKTRENLLSAQREAAYTYQAWGEEKPRCFLSAIRGGRRLCGRMEALPIWSGDGAESPGKVQNLKPSTTFTTRPVTMSRCAG